jgi:hypothetical protein
MTRRERATLANAGAVAVALAIAAASPCAHADDEVDAATLRVEKLADDAHARLTRGDFAGALELYIQANLVAPSSSVSFDIAWLYDHHLGSPALALDYYRRTVAAPDVTPELASRAQQRVRALEAAQVRPVAGGPVLGTPPSTERPDGSSSWSPLRTWALLAGGTGLAALGVGTAFVIVAKNKDDQAGRFCDGDRCTDARALTLTDEATSAAMVANVAMVTGAVFLATGVTLWLLAPSRRAVDVSVRASAGGPSFVLGGTLP